MKTQDKMFDKFGEYMLAKSATLKIFNYAMHGIKCDLTREECAALFSQRVIDLEKEMGMLV